MKNYYLTLAKREFWEHRSLWIAPLGAAAFLLLTAVVGALFTPGRVRFGPTNMDGADLAQISQFPGKVLLFVAFGIASVLLESLYAERKDRSILFWKSLPVSDRDTVVVKFGVAMLIVPAGVFALQLVTNLLLTGIASMFSRGHPAWLTSWSFVDWLSAQAQFGAVMLVAMLWYAPIAAWLMLASVFARRAPLMIAILPWAILTLSERIVLGSAHVWAFIAKRFAPGIEPLGTLTSPGLWVGLAAAAGMLYIVIRLRRYRDDT
jgi:ABC-2 type transport system permease protein